MDDLLATVQQWIPVDVLIGLTVASAIGFIGSLIAIPLILVRLPADYFDTRTPRHWMKDHHPVLRLSGLVVKNVVGIVFLLAGFAMLFLPGQGVLTMLIGVSLMDFPRKRELEAKMVSQPTLLGVINAMRRRFDKPPLTLARSLARIIHEHFCCNRRSAATTSLWLAGSSLGPSPYCTSTPQVLRAPRAGLATRLSDFATNRHE